MKKKFLNFRFYIALCTLILFLNGCSTNTYDVKDIENNSKIEDSYIKDPDEKKATYERPDQDGSPWWDVNVDNIPDAVPTIHEGSYKKSPYSVFGVRYVPMEDGTSYEEEGIASWYGTKFHQQLTANGETYDLYRMTAAHKTLPLPSYVQVTNIENNKSVIVRVNDRGPFYSNRIIDLSFAAAKKLGYADKGIAKVKVKSIDPKIWNINNSTNQVSISSTNKENKSSEDKKIQFISEQEVKKIKRENSIDVSGFYIQVGSFLNPDASELLKDKLEAEIDSNITIKSIKINNDFWYRVRVGPFKIKNEALEVQERLILLNIKGSKLIEI